MIETDQQLLARYVNGDAEEAFDEIVRLHLDLVFSAALRQVRSPVLAEEVTQSTFLDLARQAKQLAPDTVLAAWLYQVTRRRAIDVVRRESRRQQREAAACEIHAMNANLSAPDWTHIEPVLDEAMEALEDADRTAVLLRYFENKSLREVGIRLGTTEDTARKRINRAVEHLRQFFVRRGISASASGLAVLISTNAVQAAPLGLSAGIAATLFTGMASTATLTATTLATKTIAMTALQKTLIAATIAVTATTPLVLQYQANKKLNRDLQAGADRVIELQNENTRLSNMQSQVREARPVEPSGELLRLRSEVTQLRAAREAAGTSPTSNIPDSPQSPPQAASSDSFRREDWAFAGYARPESALVSMAWAASAGDFPTFLKSLTSQEQTRVQAKALRNGETEEQTRDRFASEFGQIKSIQILEQETVSENEVALKLLIQQDDGHIETPWVTTERVSDEWRMAGPRKSKATTGE